MASAWRRVVRPARGGCRRRRHRRRGVVWRGPLGVMAPPGALCKLAGYYVRTKLWLCRDKGREREKKRARLLQSVSFGEGGHGSEHIHCHNACVDHRSDHRRRGLARVKHHRRYVNGASHPHHGPLWRMHGDIITDTSNRHPGNKHLQGCLQVTAIMHAIDQPLCPNNTYVPFWSALWRVIPLHR